MYSTFIHAVRRGYLSPWPRLTSTIVSAHPPHTVATAKGHLNEHRQSLDSTHHLTSTNNTDDECVPDDLITPEPSSSSVTANHIYIKILSFPHRLSANLTGKFPVTAHSSTQYVLISKMDGYIHAEAMASHHHSVYIASFTQTIAFFTSLGRFSFFLRLDNETSLPLDNFVNCQGINIQYCPPGMHRSNRAKCSIQTFKNHAFATLCTTAKDSPLTLWDKLLPLIELCLNHLHPYKPKPAVSA